MSLESIATEVKGEIEKLNQALRVLEGIGGKRAKVPKRKMSAAGRRRVAAAQRKRWAKIRAAKK
jgi:hypothetical protein